MKKRVPKKQAFHHHHCLLVTHEESFSELINTRLIYGGHHIKEQTAVLIPNINTITNTKPVFNV